MTYIRPVRLDELSKWLQENMGDVDVETLAQKLIDKFDILTYSKASM